MMNEADINQKNGDWEEIDLREYIKILGKWKWMIILVVVAAVLTSGVISFYLLEPVYESKVVLRVNQSSEKQVTTQEKSVADVVNTVASLPVMTMNTYVGQMKSQGILEAVVNTLGLENVYSPRSLASMISATIIPDTNLIEITVSNTDPRLAKDIANVLSQEFINFITRSNQEKMHKSLDFLQQQIDQEKDNLDKASNELEKFQAQPKSVDFLENELNSKTGELAKYQAQFNDLKIELQRILAGQSKIQEQLASVPAVVISRETVKTGTAASQLQADGQVAEGVFGQEPVSEKIQEVNPTYMSLIGQVTDREIKVSETQAKLLAVDATVSGLGKEIEGLQAELAQKLMQQRTLDREVQRLEQTYSTLAEKITQAQIAASIDLGDTNLQLVSEAVAPVSPVKPNKRLNVAIAAVLGMMVSVALAFVLEFFDNTLKTSADIEKHLGLSVLGNVPNFNR